MISKWRTAGDEEVNETTNQMKRSEQQNESAIYLNGPLSSNVHGIEKFLEHTRKVRGDRGRKEGEAREEGREGGGHKFQQGSNSCHILFLVKPQLHFHQVKSAYGEDEKRERGQEDGSWWYGWKEVIVILAVARRKRKRRRRGKRRRK